MMTKAAISQPRARLIAFYLPQFHPIPENDRWWGKGFTEWTNVARAKPLYPGHYQPHIPADLGFYDLRVPEVRTAQAEMAASYGVQAFCYWHYWFAGKRLLERPFTEVLESGKPDFPFCLGWANDSWTGVWHGAPERVLMEQTYPGREDYRAHFYALVDTFQDERYLEVDGKSLFVVFRPYALPDPVEFTDCWRELAEKEGLPGFYFVGIAWHGWEPHHSGFDAYIEHPPAAVLDRFPTPLIDRLSSRLLGKSVTDYVRRIRSRPRIYSYREYTKHATQSAYIDDCSFPCIVPNWDNTPRSGSRGLILHGSTPELFGKQLDHALESVIHRKHNNRIIFIKSWNEWAEGNYLEPDQRFGHHYLEVIRERVLVSPKAAPEPVTAYTPARKHNVICHHARTS